MRGYSDMPAAKELAVEAVIGESVSVSVFPVSRENTGKYWRVSAAARQPSHSRKIQGVSSEFATNRSREFSG
jgi:hypothetical protein